MIGLQDLRLQLARRHLRCGRPCVCKNRLSLPRMLSLQGLKVKYVAHTELPPARRTTDSVNQTTVYGLRDSILSDLQGMLGPCTPIRAVGA
jgi:hypothetical protein